MSSHWRLVTFTPLSIKTGRRSCSGFCCMTINQKVVDTTKVSARKEKTVPNSDSQLEVISKKVSNIYSNDINLRRKSPELTVCRNCYLPMCPPASVRSFVNLKRQALEVQ